MTNIQKLIVTGALVLVGGLLIFILRRKKFKPPPPERFRALLFADQALDDFLSNPATRSARHSAWTILTSARALISTGQHAEAKAELHKVLEQSDVPTRIKLWTWEALRTLGERPDEHTADAVQGLVVEVPAHDSVDTIAVYSGGVVRYVDHSGKAALSDVPEGEVATLSASMLEFVKPVVHSLIQTSDHPQPGSDKAYFTVLTFSGARYGTAPIEDLTGGKHPFSPLFSMSIELMNLLAKRT